MKKVITISLIVFAMALVAPVAFAVTASSGPFDISAEVPSDLSMTVALKQNSSTGATLTEMDFGTLQVLTNTATNGQTLRSSTEGSTGTGNVTAMITVNSHGLQYTITQTGSALSNGVTTLPAGACTVVPVYAALDNGGATLPAGADLGDAESWVATDKVIYTSEAGLAEARTVQAIYSITDDPIAGATSAVPVGQSGGVYTGQVTFTVTA